MWFSNWDLPPFPMSTLFAKVDIFFSGTFMKNLPTWLSNWFVDAPFHKFTEGQNFNIEFARPLHRKVYK